MYQRLLVPVDGSSFAEQVLPYVLGMTTATGAKLTLLRVVDGEHQRPEASEYVESLAGELGAEGRCEVVGGDVAGTILQEAERVPDTLIAMSSHGRAGILEVMVGSVAASLLRRSRGPILLYRPDGALSQRPRQSCRIERIVLPLDGTPRAELIAGQAAQMARWIGARVVVVEAADARTTVLPADVPSGDLMESSYVQSRAQALGKEYGVEVGWEVLHGAPDQAICQFVHKRPDTMLAMVTRGNPAVQTAVMGSVTASCLRKGGVPLLVRIP